MADAVEDGFDWVLMVYDPENLVPSVGGTLDAEEKVAWVAMAPDPDDLSLSFDVTLTGIKEDAWFTTSEDLVLNTLEVSDPNSHDTSMNVKNNFNAAYPYSGACILLISSVLSFLCSSISRYFSTVISSLLNTLTRGLYLTATYVQCFLATYYSWYDGMCRPFMLLVFSQYPLLGYY